ncbi:MAG: Crp/Fnr family transcriptional regulator [Pseudomonadota bacterium]
MSPDDAAQRAPNRASKVLDRREIAALLPFADITDTQAQELLESANVREVGSDTTCFEAGNTADSFYLLLDGVVRIVRTTAEGEQVIMMHIVPGQMFGIAKAFENDTYSATARTACEGLVLSWPSHLWDQFSRDYPGFLSASRKEVGTRMHDLQDRVMSMATLRVEQRIAQAVLGLVQKAGLKTKDGIEISFPITRQDISEMTGTTLHAVSRYMSKWQKDGIVTSKRRRVIVRKPEALPV